MADVITSVLYYITNSSRLFGELLGKAGLSGTSRSVIILAVFAAFVIFVVGFTLGRSRILISIICVFVAFFIEKNFPYFNQIRSIAKNLPAYIVHMVIFAVAYAVSFFIFNRSVLKNRVTLKDASIVSILILSLTNVGLLASMAMSYYSNSSFFGTKNALFGWALLTLVIIYFLKGKREIAEPKTAKR